MRHRVSFILAALFVLICLTIMSILSEYRPYTVEPSPADYQIEEEIEEVPEIDTRADSDEFADSDNYIEDNSNIDDDNKLESTEWEGEG